ncbi:hypothetical protein SAMN04488503_1120 [Humidesulfovibrio mexicanus]|jgi:hypothetical protein|uniref:Uncharacterized protein n=1 Tax=Humidesulfovibrio mexicanus TaxID=147047 RepID=A0A238Z0Z5_9BACT|nr:hypothetical protein [Humidesulfovibrio mexicanus]SNR76504.1 hypothetical protein SAMN04488503_1120 [Humidesulfovibrio mexicanus]
MQLCESDAKFKYCPLLKTREDKLKFCQGSMCMFWRWANPAVTGADAEGFCGAAGPAVLAAAFTAADDSPKPPIED